MARNWGSKRGRGEMGAWLVIEVMTDFWALAVWIAGGLAKVFRQEKGHKPPT